MYVFLLRIFVENAIIMTLLYCIAYNRNQFIPCCFLYLKSRLRLYLFQSSWIVFWFCSSKKVSVPSYIWSIPEWGGIIRLNNQDASLTYVLTYYSFPVLMHHVHFPYFVSLLPISSSLRVVIFLQCIFWYFFHLFTRMYMKARYARTEKSVKDLNLSVDLLKKESVKLLQRTALAEKEMKYGHNELLYVLLNKGRPFLLMLKYAWSLLISMNIYRTAGSQFQQLAKSAYKVETRAAGMLSFSLLSFK